MKYTAEFIFQVIDILRYVWYNKIKGVMLMNTINKKLIKLLGVLDIFESQEITANNPKTDTDITYTVSNIIGTETTEYKVIQDDIDEETISLLLKAEQLKTIKSIHKMLKFFTTLTIIIIICSILLLIIKG